MKHLKKSIPPIQQQKWLNNNKHKQYIADIYGFSMLFAPRLSLTHFCEGLWTSMQMFSSVYFLLPIHRFYTFTRSFRPLNGKLVKGKISWTSELATSELVRMYDVSQKGKEQRRLSHESLQTFRKVWEVHSGHFGLWKQCIFIKTFPTNQIEVHNKFHPNSGRICLDRKKETRFYFSSSIIYLDRHSCKTCAVYIGIWYSFCAAIAAVAVIVIHNSHALLTWTFFSNIFPLRVLFDSFLISICFVASNTLYHFKAWLNR